MNQRNVFREVDEESQIIGEVPQFLCMWRVHFGMFVRSIAHLICWEIPFKMSACDGILAPTTPKVVAKNAKT